MSLWKIAWRSIQQRSLASGLTGLSMALGVTLVVVVLVTHGVISNSFTRGTGLGYDMIVGAKGGKLQLVLNTVYHLSTPVENIPYTYMEEFTKGKYKAFVARAIPVCLGDNYEGFRVVGTIPEMLEPTEFGPQYSYHQGRNFSDSGFFEGVVGSIVARQTGLKLGDEFNPTHGVSDDGQGHEHDAFKVVGVLNPTGTPSDRAIFINMEGFFLLEGHANEVKEKTDEPPPSDSPLEFAEEPTEDDCLPQEVEPKFAPVQPEAKKDHRFVLGEGHDHAHHAPLPIEQRELSAIFIRSSSAIAGVMLPSRIYDDGVAQAVLPTREIHNLFAVIVGPIQMILLTLTILVVIVSAIGILVSIYNSMSDRRREIAVMRALGARRGTILWIVVLESILLSLVGGLAGWLLGHGLIGAFSSIIEARTGVHIGFFRFVALELLLVPGLIILASLVGFLPALSAYRTDVSKSLSATP